MSEIRPLITTTPAPNDATYEPLGDGLFKLTLSRENKAEVFDYAISKLSESDYESALILQNLTTWNPSVASLFTKRSSTTILDTPFRLIFPNSALPSFDETGLYVRQYLAISYCWRSEDFLPEGYRKYGNWPISKPFVEAILSDKDHPREGIWIDQLCIDQNSLADKKISVAAMDVIYRSCIRLVVLLEDVFLDEREAVLHEKYDPTKMKFERTWRPEGDERGVFASFYNKVNAARWWERAWCFHEFNVNEPWSDKRQCNVIHNATFIVNGPLGSTVKIKWVNLQLIMGSALYVLPDPRSNVLSSFKGLGNFTGVGRGDDRENGWRSSFMAKYNGVGQKGCTHWADRLSIMINMCGVGLAYMGQELKSKEEVLYLSALLALSAGEVYPLSMIDGQSLTLNNSPTWLARSIAVGDTAIPRFKLGSVNGIYSVSTQEIELDMIFLNAAGVIVKDADLKPTYDIFPKTIKTTQPATHVPEPYLGTTMNALPDTSLDKSRRRFLAGCIINGHTFTVRLWSQLKRDVLVPNYNIGVFKDLAPNPFLNTAARNFIAQLLPVSALLGIPPPPTFTLEDAQLFLTWLTDPRSMYYISANTFHLKCTRDNHGAFVTAMSINEHFSDGPAGELRAAVPTDLLDATCIPLRVWILRPAKGEQGEGKWRLVGKALLLGEPDLMSEARGSGGREDAVVSLKEKTVVGG
ncbi:uncharacterized protein K460DRAFT_364098 [Cucurbitaria berberidis CBS 394.84]|uniref:Heterokaryon incompatibility domain-containing protein n=1 Tax=Cucurbitaria berberidis CBS 394.84 TaxID=1168544 RepID=A0A9P4LB81_9PLEO|nr:uncharacterized protein K460DRAFT_364098 [Cucurbitaria berberidis CBS 394.84]KAF1848107.1 hypothetical protein K460DRAFT_364098 [Cucurbitaria berberidis CBS 394.84]